MFSRPSKGRGTRRTDCVACSDTCTEFRVVTRCGGRRIVQGSGDVGFQTVRSSYQRYRSLHRSRGMQVRMRDAEGVTKFGWQLVAGALKTQS